MRRLEPPPLLLLLVDVEAEAPGMASCPRAIRRRRRREA